MAKSDGSTLIAWGAGLLGAYLFLPSILKAMTTKQTNGGYLATTATRQAAQGITTAGTIGSAALAQWMAQMLSKSQSGGKGGGNISAPYTSNTYPGASKAAAGQPSLFNTLNSWFGDKTESMQIANLLTGGRTVDQAARAVEESPRDIISALTGVNVTGPVPTEYAPIGNDLIDTGSANNSVLDSLIGYADSTRVGEEGYGIMPTFGTIDEPNLDNFDASNFGDASGFVDSGGDVALLDVPDFGGGGGFGGDGGGAFDWMGDFSDGGDTWQVET